MKKYNFEVRMLLSVTVYDTFCASTNVSIKPLSVESVDYESALIEAYRVVDGWENYKDTGKKITIYMFSINLVSVETIEPK